MPLLFEKLKVAVTAKVANKFSDEAASLAKEAFAKRVKVLGANPNNITNIALDPELWINATKVAGNTLGKGYTKFTDFASQIKKELGNIAQENIERLYRENIIQLDLGKGKQILSNSGKVIDEAVIREAKEKAMELAMRGQPQDVKELKEFLHKIGEKYGSEFKDEVKKTVENTIDNVFEGRRNPVINDMLGGHTIYDLFDGKIDTKHVGKTVEQLKARLKKEPNIPMSSSFTNLERANKAQREFIKHYEKEIEEWLKNGAAKPFEKSLEIGEDLGMVVGRGKTGAKMGTKVYVVLAKDGTEKGFHIVTSFPKL